MNVSKLIISMLLVTGLSSVLAQRLDVSLPESSRQNDVALRHVGEDDKEKELRQALTEIREAIQEYKAACDNGLVSPMDRRKDDQCYPPTLERLVDGIRPPNKKYYLQFLKRIPIDPLTGKADWVLRAAQDEKWAVVWGGQNVFNVFSKSDGYGSDGTRYRDW